MIFVIKLQGASLRVSMLPYLLDPQGQPQISAREGYALGGDGHRTRPKGPQGHHWPGILHLEPSIHHPAVNSAPKTFGQLCTLGAPLWSSPLADCSVTSVAGTKCNWGSSRALAAPLLTGRHLDKEMLR
jgi:hypothetical protein